MPTQLFGLTGFQRDLLTVTAGLDNPSGQEIREEMEKYYDEINHGRLYPNLDTLVEEHLLDKGQLDRRTNFYSLSEQGQEALANQCQRTNSTVPKLTRTPN